MENELLKSVHKIYENHPVATVYAADEVFVTVVGMAASDVDGVLGLSDLNTGELLTKLNIKALSRCLRFDFTEDQTSVLIGIIIEAGTNLLKVSEAVQTRVMSAVKDYIGTELNKVNIQISDVRNK